MKKLDTGSDWDKAVLRLRECMKDTLDLPDDPTDAEARDYMRAAAVVHMAEVVEMVEIVSVEGRNIRDDIISLIDIFLDNPATQKPSLLSFLARN
jgi:hypothetical protein